MVTVVVGHRGVGKSTLAKRWQMHYDPPLSVFDLDAEIEVRTGQKISDIFKISGESKFRILEKEIFGEILQVCDDPCAIVVGGGFNLDLIPSGIEILWVRRDTDQDGRVFLDRPRLERDVDPLLEYKMRYEVREEIFKKRSSRIYTMPEGLCCKDDAEASILRRDNIKLSAFITLSDRHLHAKLEYEDCIYEIRNDLLSPEQVRRALEIYPHEKLLYSIRVCDRANSDLGHLSLKVDWDVGIPRELGKNPHIISTHESQIEKAIDSLKAFESSNIQLKLCPLVESWEQLWLGFEWQKMNPQLRSFLPRSPDGSLSWFRQLMKGKQPINFIREDQGSSADQPTLWEWLSCPAKIENFAAILGYPVRHSYSPTYHKNFFKKFNMPILKVPVDKKSWKKAISYLDKFGLRAAAVTSPLKEEAGTFVHQRPLNTLVRKKSGEWLGMNTDLHGAYSLIEPYMDKKIAIWGGGGVLETLKDIISDSQFYSVRTGHVREGSKPLENPDVVLWAAGEGSLEKIPQSWKPQVLVDLNYRQNSEGLIYAQKIGCHYVSGIKMFEVQAQEQQKFWDNFLS